MKEQIQQRANELQEQLVEVRRHLHRYPELSFQEYQTAAFVLEQLNSYGIDAKLHSETGIVALIKGENGDSDRVLALRADLDALPLQEKSDKNYCSEHSGVMHACGHDVHTTSLLGTAMILHDLRSSFAGTVKFIFQPGEEKLPGGASIMIKNGVLKDPEPQAILGQHVFPDLEAGKVGFRAGKYMASCDEIYLTVKGKGGHGALPHKVIDPVLIGSHIIVALQQIVSRRSNALLPTVLSFGCFNANGATNVIPDEAKLEGTFRTYDEEWREEAHKLIRQIAEQTAGSMGASCEVKIEKGYPFVYNDPLLTDQARLDAEAYLGKENVVDLEMRPTGEDFSFYTHTLPGTFYRLGVRNELKGITSAVHTTTFDVDEACLSVGSGLMAWLAIQNLKR